MSELKMADIVENNDGFEQINNMFQEIMRIPDDLLNSTTMAMYKSVFDNLITPELMEKNTKNACEFYHQEGIAYSELKHDFEMTKNSFKEYINELQPSEYKRELLEAGANVLGRLLDDTLAHYNAHDFNLPVRLDPNAHVPIYAHETDAAADIYASQDIVIPAHSMGTKVPTGLYIALPDRWFAAILPRSSIGAKTPLRLSNSMGVIDSDYRGEIGVLYDNISDSDYTIHAGERIAQMLILPVHQFRPVPVDTLPNTERSDGGFGSTGK